MSTHLQVLRDTYDADAYAARDAEAAALRQKAVAQHYGEHLAAQRRRRRKLAAIGLLAITAIVGVALC
jgi:hypothetical protein